MWHYEDTITVPDETTLGTLGTIEDEVMAVGHLIAAPRGKVTFAIEAESLWDLRGIVDDLSVALEAYGVHYEADPTKTRGDSVGVDEFAFRNEVYRRIGIPVRNWLRTAVPTKQKGSALNGATQFGDALFHVIDKAMKEPRDG